ncbi:MAG: hypothetical protein UW43_C0001G0011 [Candidatus Yanofskybacteria bacterium GW2011_GWA1_44_21]|uniref:HTH deoR-type domain-containing protein n=2 Tax=Candidatus Yanofskyibacteriota TaxID=1752733 RepID=A0A1F8H2V8_9BACT|nr:MAG: hypothetical protein UW14_C0006G0004 [Candidatus Yanofskybacteria bacterium GW2011_GWA2_44_10]KKT50846.1 MAG: hypothetical protein UW43_C0001G0011 [Candidatus Yanofskybacteria bacterium GW2011_GWA1_44_21]KKT90419.1 MAG: hypothetical protein UW90_C0001G0007 [Candidatus Yanofskybacteria bacterium GW2011_GWB1_45_11]OGN02591.1 MAG: hypothetical protein A2657_00405 [Candidatus Yanofskybacteria bacterium RIFCSPHIGHO2_01_FULL_44_110b]OGN14223.1 MAG: hypothetical protein A3C01_01335 [Candidatus
MSVFADSLLSLSKVLARLSDQFYVSKLDEKIKRYIDIQISVLADSGKNNSLIHILNELIDCLDFIEHDQADIKEEILNAKKYILQLKVDVYRSNNPKNTKTTSRPSTRSANTELFKGNKGKILDFIKKNRNVRSKDVVDEFNLLPKRTVIRNLKELLSAGLISKMNENRAVFYSSRPD